MIMKSIRLLDVPIHDLPVETLINSISQAIQTNSKTIVANVNIHAMNLAYQLPSFRRFLNKADIVFCDGFGVMLGAYLCNSRIVNRYTPPDWIELLCETCVKQGFSLYFLGARPGVAEKAANRLKSKFPNLNIVGTYHGYFSKQIDSTENEIVIRQINEAQPNILIVCFGMPMQEMWLDENWTGINANIAIPAGALFDYVSGEVVRAPRWMTDYGFEWLGRLLIEPRRLWYRYLVGNLVFFWRILRNHLFCGH